jgi:hypothetical protein
MDEFKKGDVVYYDFRKVIGLGKSVLNPGFFCVVRGIKTYKNIKDYILLVYEDERDSSGLDYRFIANPEHLIKVDPDTPQNRLLIQLKYA